MKENVREYVFNCFVNMLPLLISAIFIFIEHAMTLCDISNISPMLGLSCVFFWLFYRSDMFNIFSVTFLGALSDMLNYTPMGASLFSFLLMYVLEMKISKYMSNKLFVVNFTSFAALFLLVLLAQWVILCLYYKEILPFLNVFLSWLLTVSLYPLVARINLFISEKFKTEDFE